MLVEVPKAGIYTGEELRGIGLRQRTERRATVIDFNSRSGRGLPCGLRAMGEGRRGLMNRAGEHRPSLASFYLGWAVAAGLSLAGHAGLILLTIGGV